MSIMKERKEGLVSLIAPMYNEEESITPFFDKVEEVFSSSDINYEIVCVNDGSSDNTLELLREYSKSNKRIRIVDLARNFGKEIALTAGIDHSKGNAVVPIDCDMQDPPEVVVKMFEKWCEGYDMVLAKRIDRSSDSFIKRTTSGIFYKLMSQFGDVSMPQNVGDFRLMDRKVVEALEQYRERSRFMKGIFATLGFNQCTVEYVRSSRFAGTTKWSYLKLYGLALEGIVSFTTMPLKIWSYIGASVALGAFIYGFYLIIRTIAFGIDTPGYASLMVALLFMTGLILLCLGVIGEYLSRIFIEVKQRPLYITNRNNDCDR